MSTEPIHFFNRYTETIEKEAIYGEPYLRWAYGTPIGKLTVQLIVKRLFFSHWYGWRMNLAASQKRIAPFLEQFGLDAKEFEKNVEEFEHFNDFFSRKLRPSTRPVDNNNGAVVFPADGRHLGFQNLSEIDGVFVKGQSFKLAELFQDEALAARFKEGSAILSRLCPTDYHRFHFSIEGTPSEATLVRGALYSVSPLALRQNLSYLWHNKRMITHLESDTLGKVTIVEFGATNVGSVTQTFTPNKPVQRGEEKGFFSFGASATMTFFEPGRITLMPDLTEHSQSQREVYARMGDTMASAAC